MTAAEARWRHTVASYADYADAERAVDWLSDRGFPVHRGTIVGTGLRSVERVEGRMTTGRAAQIGAIAGLLLGALVALLFGIFPWTHGSAALLASSLALGTLFGVVAGALFHEAMSGGRRDFVSTRRIEAERYDVQVDAEVAAEATRLLDAMP